MDSFCFIEKDWKTNRTYDDNFSMIPKKSGVYLLVNSILSKDLQSISHEILYVGSSQNLNERYNKHSTFRVLKQVYGDTVRFYFKETDKYLEEEKVLIRKTQARFNKQWL